MTVRKPFARVQEHRWLAGVAGGIAYAMGWPVLVVRLIALGIVVVFGGNQPTYYAASLVIIAYVVLWAFSPRWPEEPADYAQRTA